MAKEPTPAATPENTPVPGGGRWKWNYATTCWVEVLEDPVPESATTPPTQTIELKE